MAFEYNYQLTQKAENDLDGIVSYIALELANPTAAANFIDKLLSGISGICHFPESGSVVINDYLPSFGVRKIVVNNYIVYYLPNHDEKMITVLRIVYGRRNMDEILSQMDI